MQRSRTRALGAVAALFVSALAVGATPGTATGASGTPGGGVAVTDRATTSAAADRVEDYWTAKRMRTAKTPERPSAATAADAPVARGAEQRVGPKKPGGGPVPMASTTATTGKVFFTLGGTNYVCSGAATSSSNRDVVTTAGHCLNEGPGAFATNFWATIQRLLYGFALALIQPCYRRTDKVHGLDWRTSLQRKRLRLARKPIAEFLHV